MTLKLVASPGTEAFAGTAFSVLTPGGDTIREAIGAFPQVTLAEGEYQLSPATTARSYTQDFKVESGVDRTSRRSPRIRDTKSGRSLPDFVSRARAVKP